MSGLRDLIGRLGTSPSSIPGVPANITYAQEGRTNPQTVPLMPGFPGLILAPGDRPLSPEEQQHEGVHAALGLPGAAAGVLGAELMGVGDQGAYLAPDEVLAYMAQPDTPESQGDINTISSMVDALKRQDTGNMGYLDLVKAFTQGSLRDLMR